MKTKEMLLDRLKKEALGNYENLPLVKNCSRTIGQQKNV